MTTTSSSELTPAQIALALEKLVLERILAIGITGSGKSYQWLKIARVLKPTGAKFRCVDTDNDIDYMLRTQFLDLLPENGGNVYVHPAFSWPEYERSVAWIQQKGITPENEAKMDKYLLAAYKAPIRLFDWVVVDKINNAWSTVQRYFTSEVFGEGMGEYFLQVRREMQAGIRKTAKGGMPSSPIMEGLDGWKDWSVINKLYDDWILPIIHRVRCNVYAASDVVPLDRKTDKDPIVLNVFGDIGVKAAGQKALGGQHHSIFLLIPGTERWLVTTIKDRAGRPYFKSTPLTSLYMQYLVVKAGWPII